MRRPETDNPERIDADPDMVALLVAVILPDTFNPDKAEREPDTVSPLVAVIAPETDNPERAETDPVAVIFPATLRFAFADDAVGSFIMLSGPCTLTLSAVVRTSNGMVFSLKRIRIRKTREYESSFVVPQYK